MGSSILANNTNNVIAGLQSQSSCPIPTTAQIAAAVNKNDVGAALKEVLISAGITSESLTKVADATNRYNANPIIQGGIKNNKIKDDFFRIRKNYLSVSADYDIALDEYCTINPNVELCQENKRLQYELLGGGLDKIKTSNNDLRDSIELYIDLYGNNTIAFGRLSELLGSLTKDIAYIDNKIDKSTTDMNIDNRKSQYEIKQQDINSQIQNILIFVYYELLLFYFLVSDFFKSARYMSPKHIIIIVLYLVLPFIIRKIGIFIIGLLPNVKLR